MRKSGFNFNNADGFNNGNGKFKAWTTAVANKPAILLNPLTTLAPGLTIEKQQKKEAEEKAASEAREQASWEATNAAITSASNEAWNRGAAAATTAIAQQAATQSPAPNANSVPGNAPFTSQDLNSGSSGGGIPVWGWIGISVAGLAMVGGIVWMAVKR